MAKRQSEASKLKPAGREPTEFENFTRALKQIFSVKKSDLDIHKPIYARKKKA